MIVDISTARRSYHSSTSFRGTGTAVFAVGIAA